MVDEGNAIVDGPGIEANHLYGLCLTYTANKLGTAT